MGLMAGRLGVGFCFSFLGNGIVCGAGWLFAMGKSERCFVWTLGKAFCVCLFFFSVPDGKQCVVRAEVG